MPIKQFPPIYKGQETPLELFDFVIPLYNYYYHIGCTGTVISSRHLLTSAWCVYQKSRTKDSQLTEYSSYKSLHGKFYPDFRSKNVQSNIVQPVNAIAYFPSNYKRPWKHNFAVIEFPEGTDFGVEPVTLANDYIKVFFEDLIVAGFGKYEFK
uniref:Peptidase S1 domain-containing protein n=1 Tax=Panagrolaimus sp. ES5 TaxID=591445 RepID=A0AC34GEE4_9BILA